ncbi:amidohydrolase family protein [Agrococcus sp. ARC_14]|uniref:amidohydrolase family protein n=1 Tax=Agrococcus sp. ARC_14 TaxID=2919927 RepID=UPI001F056DB2|nr:amidohydrolase family protein [Agrococcus sp. ARC_14]MCH1881911.1 amidohydrolase [Agrococcus sp. ARC_14]
MRIDTHGHFTTAPPKLEAFRGRQLASLNRPSKGTIAISDDEIREGLQRQLREMQASGTDKLIFSPRASGMGHEVGDERVSTYWTQHSNDLIHRASQLYPGTFYPAAQLPQSPGVSPANCIPELRRVVEELGFVGVNVNPDVAGGGQPFTPAISDPWWYPLWEAVVELDVPVLLHATSTVNPALHLNGSHYINSDTAVTFELAWSDLFERFPELKIIVPHGGGSMAYQFNRHRALHIQAGRPPFEERVRNFYFDTALYDRDSIEMLIRKVGADNVLFAAEIVGTAKVIDPETGKQFDDTASFIEDIEWLSAEDKAKVFSGNARKLYSRASF